jgi:hypothetical protein
VLTGPLGFRLSDTVPGVLSWYRCSADHHGIAIAPGTVSGLHHYVFELDGWASMQAFADHLTLNDVLLTWDPVVTGPGATSSPTTWIRRAASSRCWPTCSASRARRPTSRAPGRWCRPSVPAG